MLSLIICSKVGRLTEECSRNLTATIGCDHEVVLIDNSDARYSIFQAYNEGVRRAKGDILCFMHEDVKFHQTDWGTKVEAAFLADARLGLVGVAGSRVVVGDGDFRVTHHFLASMLQGHLTFEHTPTYFSLNHKVAREHKSARVAAVDGCWFCIPRLLFDEDLSFDEATFDSFHLYDADISLQVQARGLDVALIDGIQIEHFSEGDYNPTFLESLHTFAQKWDGHLPMAVGVEMSKEELVSESEFSRKLTQETIEACRISKSLRQGLSEGQSLKQMVGNMDSKDRALAISLLRRNAKLSIRGNISFSKKFHYICSVSSVVGFATFVKLMFKLLWEIMRR